MVKRPRSKVQSVVVHMNDVNNEGQWIPRKFEKYAWITLSAPKQGPWAKEAKRARMSTMEADIKAQIKEFKIKKDSNTVESILVAHAYTRRQLQLKDNNEKVGECNCKCDAGDCFVCLLS
jgi:hypothetical protein